MKSFVKNFLRANGVVVALALTNVSAHASIVNLTAILHGGPQFTALGGGFGANSVTAGVFDVHFADQDFLAFGIQPTVAFNGASNNYTSSHFVASDSVKRLYEGYYSTVVGSNLNNPAPKAKAFQLALWELVNDNGNLLSGNLRFANLSNAVVADSNAMLATALGSGQIFDTFVYTSLSSAGPGINSQKMLTVFAFPEPQPVSDVPEPQTCALVIAGLGLMRRFARGRRKPQSEAKSGITHFA